MLHKTIMKKLRARDGEMRLCFAPSPPRAAEQEGSKKMNNDLTVGKPGTVLWSRT